MWDRLDDLLSEYRVRSAPVRPPNTFTIREFGQRHGIKRTQCLWIINDMMKQGQLTRIRQGRSVYYSPKP